jgi:hypothetical protein
MSDIQKFDPSTLMQGVKDRIKSTFVSMIPDDQWDTMVQKEVDGFFAAKERRNNYERTSDFSELVQKELQEECKKRLLEYLSSEEFKSVWDTKGQVVTAEAVKQMIVNNSGEIMTSFFGGMFTSMLSQFRNHLMTQGARY